MTPAPGEWKPRPVDTSGVRLPPELNGLVEVLAENVHDTWAARRLADGWTWGPSRDDRTLTHPMLIPYRELPETEKDYDRDVVEETVRLILALGYRIGPPVS
ncbi:RyR domain-containing protein [Streptacidiphilus monticola]|uniref:RyR domain-containing protein n=1 Tax=Streptacidiphilus monticola TaxID=2161674 RepID=A0ABW1G7T6_9ACTN